MELQAEAEVPVLIVVCYSLQMAVAAGGEVEVVCAGAGCIGATATELTAVVLLGFPHRSAVAVAVESSSEAV
jgi:hypothetical protein